MPNRNKKVQCLECNHTMRSDTLGRHMKTHSHLPEPASGGSGISTVGVDEQKDSSNAISDKYVWREKGVNKNHCFLLPRDIRAIVVGKSGFGKSTLLTHLLLEPGMLDYDTLTVCGRSLHQPEYKIMNAAFSKHLSKAQVNKIFEQQDRIMEIGGAEEFIEDYEGECKGGIDTKFYDDVANIPDPSEHDPSRKNLLIFDDIMLGPQSRAEAYYTRGRHNNVDVIYIAQSYFRLPRQTVRENANLYMFFKQDKTNLSHIYQDHCAVDDIPLEVFRGFCSNVWNESKHNFVTIDLTRPACCGKYRKNLNDYWTPFT